MIRIENAHLYTGLESFDRGCALVDGDRILYAGDAENCPDSPGATVIDGQHGILMPGFYNAHTHAAMVLLRGVGSDLVLHDWLEQIYPHEDKLEGALVRQGTNLAIMEMIRRGVVGFADMYFYMDEVAKAALDCGMRVNLVRGVTSVEGADDNARFYRDYDGAGGGLVKVYIGLHGEYTTNPEIAAYAIDAARDIGTGVHVHISETRAEVEGCFARHQVSPVRYFTDLGLFENPVIAAHCVHCSDEDIRLLRDGGAYVVHNPASNLKLASGIAPIARYIQAGIPVALGTDGASSNNTLDMLADMRLAALLQKGAFADPTLMSAQQALHMATRVGALAMGFDDCGLLQAGMKADMILLDGHTTTHIPMTNDLPSAIVYAAQGQDVRMTMVNGQILYHDGTFATLDPKQVLREGEDAARALGVA